MAGLKGFAAVAALQRRAVAKRGGSEKRADLLSRDAADALARWRDAYLESLQARNYSAETVESRGFALAQFLGWAAARDVTRAGAVTRPMLEAYQRWLWRQTRADGRPLGWGTQQAKLGTLKGFFRWLTRQDAILHNPASELELPRPEKRLPPTAPTPGEIARLLAVPDVADPLGLRDRAMLELFYSTGLRRTELCGLGLAELNLERRTLTVRRGKGKKDRVVPVGGPALHWVQRYVQEVRPRLGVDTRETALFLSGYGTAFKPDAASRLVTAYLRRAGLVRPGSCHLLRHACATHMLEGGADIRFIQQLLGHENLDTTAIYTEVTIRQLQEVHGRCHPAGGAGGGAAEKPASVPGADPAA